MSSNNITITNTGRQTGNTTRLIPQIRGQGLHHLSSSENALAANKNPIMEDHSELSHSSDSDSHTAAYIASGVFISCNLLVFGIIAIILGTHIINYIIVPIFLALIVILFRAVYSSI